MSIVHPLVATSIGILAGSQVYALHEARYLVRVVSVLFILYASTMPEEEIGQLLPALAGFYAMDIIDYIRKREVLFTVHHLLVISMVFWPRYEWGLRLIQYLGISEVSSLIYYMRVGLRGSLTTEQIQHHAWTEPPLNLLFLSVFVYTRFVKINIFHTFETNTEVLIVIAFTLLNVLWFFLIILRVLSPRS